MATKIIGFQNRPVPVGAEKSAPRTGDAAASRGPDASGSASAGSPVRITDQARQLSALEQAVHNSSAVSEARVAAIRSAIEEGRYEIAPQRIADKMLRLDQELRAAEK